MSISLEDAQALCSETEWKTLIHSYPPKISDLAPSAAKKHGNRIRKFLSKEESAEGDKKRIAVFSEALERLDALVPDKADKAKLEARREKEKAARERIKSVKDKRSDVRDRLLKKAEEEKAEKEGTTDGKSDKKAAASGVSGVKQSGKRSQGKIGSRKV